MIALDDETVTALLPMADAIELMRGALRAYSAGQVRQPVREMVEGAGDDLYAIMPAYLQPAHGLGGGGFGVKVIAIKPGNPARGLDAHVGIVTVFDAVTGSPRAVMDGARITAIRTPAVSAVATDLLARPAAGVLAILGSGVQARGHLEAISLVRRLHTIRVWSRDPDRARELATWARPRVAAQVVVAGTAAAAARDADIICTTTASARPLLRAADVRAGAHINAVGSSVPGARELATDLVGQCMVFVDSQESALREAGELLIPMREGALGPDHIRAEVGHVLLGRRPGRTADDETTLFKSLGLAVEDVLCGLALDARARERGLGASVALSGAPPVPGRPGGPAPVARDRT